VITSTSAQSASPAAEAASELVVSQVERTLDVFEEIARSLSN